MKNYTQNIFFVLAFFLVAANLRPAIASVSPLLETIRNELGMSSFAVSFLTTIPVLCMGIFAPFSARLGIRWGIERMIMICLVVIGTMTFMRALSSSSLFLLVTTLFIGIAIAIAGALLSGFIKRMFPAHAASMMGVYSVGLGVGTSLSAGFTIPLQGVLQGSWTLALAVWSVLAIIALLFWWPVMAKGAQNPNAVPSTQGEGKLPWKNKRAWLFTIIFGLQASLYYSIVTWLAPMTEALGLSKVYAGVAITVFTFVQMICSLVIPIAVNYYHHRRIWLIGCSLITLIGLAFFFFSYMISVWISIILLGIGLGGLLPLSMMLPLYETSTVHDASAWTALVLSVGYIFAGCIPTIIGWVHDISGSYQSSYIGMTILCSVLLVFSFSARTGQEHKIMHSNKEDNKKLTDSDIAN
ncbi:MFS transporter [Aneurinibacillus tyrosinisolvens]|uniref:MFS transporter n=1 Tax=Aneurinibacillus tyrosinisolvens TaxID=1443435 RepID=UPI00063FA881|nr:MFS transporter [Aneurinibacillus tyrosinisolvens]